MLSECRLRQGDAAQARKLMVRVHRERLDRPQHLELERRLFYNFATLIVGWVLAPGRVTISQALRAGGGLKSGKHFSTFYRFFADASWVADDLGQVVFLLMLPFVQVQGLLYTPCRGG